MSMDDSGSAIESIIDHQDDEDFPFELEEDWQAVSEGTSCLVFTFKDVPQVEEDGALLRVKKRTPVQYIKAPDKEVTEWFMGKGRILHVDSSGIFSIHEFDTSTAKGKKMYFTIKSGEIMCVCAEDGQLEMLEHVKPGFTTNDFETVSHGASKIGDTNIPNEFWENVPLSFSITPLQDGDIDLLVPILEQHVKDRNTGVILEDEIKEIKGFMNGEQDGEGRIRKYFVARTPEGKVLGCMAYSSPDHDMQQHFKTGPIGTVEILNAFVTSENFRGAGIGKALFKRICENAKENGNDLLVVHSGPRYKSSWGFYDKMCDESFGFIEEKYGRGGDAKTWRKIL